MPLPRKNEAPSVELKTTCLGEEDIFKKKAGHLQFLLGIALSPVGTGLLPEMNPCTWGLLTPLPRSGLAWEQKEEKGDSLPRGALL